MKSWRKRGLRAAAALLSLLVLAYPGSLALLPEGSVVSRDIVSCCVGDAEGGGAQEFLVITGGGKTDAGERCGNFLLVCDASAKADLDKLGYIPPGKIRHCIDLSRLRPMKVQLGDVNGDGVNEVAVCAYKTAKFHPVMAKRPFFFDLNQGNLIPVWLGSRLSRPFDDYILSDIDRDGRAEIVSVERLESGACVLAAYFWKGFGFEMLAQSEGYDGELRFAHDASGQAARAGEILVLFSRDGEDIGLKFSLSGDMLTAQNQSGIEG